MSGQGLEAPSGSARGPGPRGRQPWKRLIRYLTISPTRARGSVAAVRHHHDRESPRGSHGDLADEGGVAPGVLQVANASHLGRAPTQGVAGQARAVDLFKGRGADEEVPHRVGPTSQVEANVPLHVPQRGMDRARRSDGRGIVGIGARRIRRLGSMSPGRIRRIRAGGSGRPEAGILHAKRAEQTLPHQILPARPGRNLVHATRDHVPEIRVTERSAGYRCWPEGQAYRGQTISRPSETCPLRRNRARHRGAGARGPPRCATGVGPGEPPRTPPPPPPPGLRPQSSPSSVSPARRALRREARSSPGVRPDVVCVAHRYGGGVSQLPHALRRLVDNATLAHDRRDH